MKIEFFKMIILALLIVIIADCQKGEHFWSYDKMRDYYYCKYRYPSSKRCSLLKTKMDDFRNNIEPIGMVYSISKDNDISYPLYGWYDDSINRFVYYIKQGTYIEQISTNYDLVHGQVINILNEKFRVDLYEKGHIWAVNTRYNDNIPWDNVGYLISPQSIYDDYYGNSFKTFTLLERELDPRRDQYEYGIEDENGNIIYLPQTRYLEHDENITIPSKRKLGTYKVYRYSMNESLLTTF